jgi:hypothetical protein
MRRRKKYRFAVDLSRKFKLSLPRGPAIPTAWRKSNWETLEKLRKEALEMKTPWQSDRSI